MDPRFFSTIDAPKYIESGVLYEKKPVTNVWGRLTAVAKQQWKWKNVGNDQQQDPRFLGCRQRLLQIYGPPGSGKSTATFHWVRLVCETCRTTAYWISCATEAQKCWSIQGAEDSGKAIINEYAVPQTTDDALDASIVVFDGIRAKTLETWRGMMNDLARKGIAVIVVSSEGVRFHDGDSQDIMKLQHFVPSWTMAEYYAACSNDEFWARNYQAFPDGALHDDENRRQQLLQNKFLLAGHCARFMFRDFPHEIIQKITQDAQTINMDSLERAVRNTRSAGAVNTVVARLQADKNGITPPHTAEIPHVEDWEEAAGVNRADFRLLESEIDHEKPEPCLVSAFASEEVAKNIPSSIGRLRNVARALSNKVIERYAFEQQLRKSLQEAVNPGRSLVLEETNGQRVAYPVEKFISCDASELEATLRNNLVPNAWIFVVGYRGTETHFLLDVIDLLLQNLMDLITWTHFDFLVLRPITEKHKSFSLNPARGSLQPFLRFDEAQWDRREYLNNVNYKFLDWTDG